MADISKIDNGTEYNLKDATARAGIASSKTLKSSVVTVNDAAPINAEDITVDITPKQDLHGYDRPWAGGAWKNQAYDVTYTSTKNQYASVIRTSYKLKQGKRYVISFYTVNTDISVYRETPSTLGFDSLSEYSFICDGTRKSMYGTATADATISNVDIFKRASATSDVECGLCYNLQIEEVADTVTTPTTFAPYSNECPIAGRTGAKLDRCGKNLWDENYTGISQSITYKPIYVGDGSFTLRTTTPRWDDSGCAVFLLAGNVSSGADNANHGAYSGSPRTQTAVNGYVTVAYRMIVDINPRDYDTELIKTNEITTTTITFGETVHGGKWHVTAGGTDKTYGNIANYNGETINEPWLSSLDEYSPGATPTTGAQVVYPLTTPTTISTPKQNVPMLKGINTVSADCGDTSLKYQPDNVIGELKGEIEDIKDSAKVKGRYPIQSTASSGSYKFEIDVYRRGDIIGVDSFAFDRGQSCPSGYVSTVLPNVALNHYKPIEDAFFVFRHISGKGVVKITLRDDGQVGFSCYIMESMTGDVAQDGWLFEQNWIQLAADLFNN